MRLLRTHVENCLQHPEAGTIGDQGGGIRCGFCGIEVGQWNLPWQPQWAVGAENGVARVVARGLPQSVVRWALSRAIAHATQPRWGDLFAQSLHTISAHDVALRWELRTPALRLPHLPEWMRNS